MNSNGSLDTAFDPGAGANGPVNLISYWENKAMISGGFITYNDISRPGIAKILSAGSAVNPAINYLLLLE